jgi:hypothetical protein
VFTGAYGVCVYAPFLTVLVQLALVPPSSLSEMLVKGVLRSLGDFVWATGVSEGL